MFSHHRGQQALYSPKNLIGSVERVVGRSLERDPEVVVLSREQIHGQMRGAAQRKSQEPRCKEGKRCSMREHLVEYSKVSRAQAVHSAVHTGPCVRNRDEETHRWGSALVLGCRVGPRRAVATSPVEVVRGKDDEAFE